MPIYKLVRTQMDRHIHKLPRRSPDPRIRPFVAPEPRHHPHVVGPDARIEDDFSGATEIRHEITRGITRVTTRKDTRIRLFNPDSRLDPRIDGKVVSSARLDEPRLLTTQGRQDSPVKASPSAASESSVVGIAKDPVVFTYDEAPSPKDGWSAKDSTFTDAHGATYYRSTILLPFVPYSSYARVDYSVFSVDFDIIPLTVSGFVATTIDATGPGLGPPDMETRSRALLRESRELPVRQIYVGSTPGGNALICRSTFPDMRHTERVLREEFRDYPNVAIIEHINLYPLTAFLASGRLQFDVARAEFSVGTLIGLYTTAVAFDASSPTYSVLTASARNLLASCAVSREQRLEVIRSTDLFVGSKSAYIDIFLDFGVILWEAEDEPFNTTHLSLVRSAFAALPPQITKLIHSLTFIRFTGESARLGGQASDGSISIILHGVTLPGVNFTRIPTWRPARGLQNGICHEVGHKVADYSSLISVFNRLQFLGLSDINSFLSSTVGFDGVPYLTEDFAHNFQLYVTDSTATLNFVRDQHNWILSAKLAIVLEHLIIFDVTVGLERIAFFQTDSDGILVRSHASVERGPARDGRLDTTEIRSVNGIPFNDPLNFYTP